MTRWRRYLPECGVVRRSLEGPTLPRRRVGGGDLPAEDNALLCAPTGSGKTLASFIWGIERSSREPGNWAPGEAGLTFSPLKRSYDIERKPAGAAAGIGAEIAVGMRTGDTRRGPQGDAKTPHDILITPKSRSDLMMSSAVRAILPGSRR